MHAVSSVAVHCKQLPSVWHNGAVAPHMLAPVVVHATHVWLAVAHTGLVPVHAACELAVHCARRVVGMEAYMGLVEVGVGMPIKVAV